MPLLGIVIVKAANHFGMVDSNSLFQFTLMLQYALPPAMNVGMYDYFSFFFFFFFFLQPFKLQTVHFEIEGKVLESGFEFKTFVLVPR
jgi:hypothetical protein